MKRLTRLTDEAIGALGVLGLLAIAVATGAVPLPNMARDPGLLRTPAARAVATMEADWRIPVKHHAAAEFCGCSLGQLRLPLKTSN